MAISASAPRARRLCASLCAAFSLVTPASALATAVSSSLLASVRVQRFALTEVLASTVTDCGDSGSPGSLRYLAAYANPGETIDVANCSQIELQGGIVTPYFTPLTIDGGGNATIVASAIEPAFGSLSDLTIANLTIVGGNAVAVGMDGLKKGGAIVAAYGVTLLNSTISGGTAKDIGAKGGAIYAYGDVTLINSTVTGARAVNAGGCIYGKGSVILQNSTVSECRADAYNYLGAYITATGGAIAAGSVTLRDSSQVIHGVAIGSAICTYGGYYGCYNVVPDTHAKGGGIAAGTLTCNDSTIKGSYASSGYYDGITPGAGIHAFDMTLTRCSVVDNESYGGAGIYVPAAGHAQIVESSISGNSEGIEGRGYVTLTRSTVAGNKYLGLRLTTSFTQILQSTISGNFTGIEGTGNVILIASTITGNGYYGVSLTGNVAAQSSIIAKNSAAALYPVFDLNLNGPLSGADNLIMATNASPPPGVITVTVDPLLLPLANNGGPTLTHALPDNSPAINKGDNAANYPSDQRGSGFVRSFGRPDIGAYEWQVPGDEVFYAGFEELAR